MNILFSKNKYDKYEKNMKQRR